MLTIFGVHPSNMKNNCISFLLAGLLLSSLCAAQKSAGLNLIIAPATVTDNAATLLWDKQYAADGVVYKIFLNGKEVGSTDKTNYEVTGLTPATQYTAEVRQADKKSAPVKFKTVAKGNIYNILDYGAKADTTVRNTKAIQKAIDACAEGGTVYIPKGVFVTGALFLKSNMTLYIEAGAVLKGSTDIADYTPMIMNRFEGWEMMTYASLINAGTINRKGGYSVKNLRITGGGTISGGGRKLGEAMIKASGMRSRGRLILLMNCQDVSISNLTLTEPASWTLHYIYSDNISCHGLTIVTDVRNGDGIDPDSSTDSYIFNCVFDTGDDCIAIKSGKNPEGYYIGKPTKNVRITHCDFKRGHGISIGSEMSGGVSDVLVQDCTAGALLHGMQIKGTKDRGGYVKNVTVADCKLLKITVFSSLNYNNDGESAPELPSFENLVFRNIDLTEASTKEPVININGFKGMTHRVKNLTFENIRLPESANVTVNDCESIKFMNVLSVSGTKPTYTIKESTGISYK